MSYVWGDFDGTGKLTMQERCTEGFIVRSGPPRYVEPDWDMIADCWNAEIRRIKADPWRGQSAPLIKSISRHQTSPSATDIQSRLPSCLQGHSAPLVELWSVAQKLEPDFLPHNTVSQWGQMQLRKIDWDYVAEGLEWETAWPLENLIPFDVSRYVTAWLCHVDDINHDRDLEFSQYDWYEFDPDKACEIARNRFGGWIDDARV